MVSNKGSHNAIMCIKLIHDGDNPFVFPAFTTGCQDWHLP